MMRTATIRSLPTGIELSTPYEADFVDALKATVPSRGRKWDSDRKVWTVSQSHAAEAVRLLHQYFHVVDLREDTTKEQREQEQQRQERERRYSHGHSSYAALHLQPTAPPELIKSAYYCLAKIYHPDHGGDLSTMQRINRAYEELKK